MIKFIQGDTLKIYTKFGYVPFIFGKRSISYVFSKHVGFIESNMQEHVNNNFIDCGSRILLTEKFR